MDLIKRHGKRVAVEGLGWLLIVVGLAALILPGPGLLALFAGLALLATQYEWAERRLNPVRKAALKTAADSVASWPRILFSVLLSFILIGFGVLWSLQPSQPAWWPLADRLWLFGGRGTGYTLIVSGLIAFGMIVYSYRTYRPQK